MIHGFVYILLVFALSASFNGCGNSGNFNTSNGPLAAKQYLARSNQYFAGYYNDGSKDIPCYWSGKTRIDLPVPSDGSDEGFALSPAILSGDTVYIAGNYFNGSRWIPCYWAGGARIDLQSGSNFHAIATSISVFRGTAYTAGYYFDGFKDVPCYWAGTSRTDLMGDGTHDAYATSIAVVDGTVYTAGYYFDGSKNVPCYWVGTVRTDLPGNGTKEAFAFSITVSDDAVFTAGHYFDGLRNIPCYWIGNTRIDLSTDGAHDAYVSSIAVSNGNVYTAGFYYNDTKAVPCFWTNTIRTDLPTYGSIYDKAVSIVVSGSTIYTAGSCYDGSKNIPCYWIGTTRSDLAVDGAPDAKVMSSLLSFGDINTKGAWMNVRTFGAKGDGVADDRAAIQRAVDHIHAQGGGVVYVPAGTYMIKTFSSGYETVTPKTGVSVVGSGPSTVFKFGNNLRNPGQGFSFLYDHNNPIANITYSNFAVDWNGQNNPISASNTILENVNRMGGAAGVYNVRFKNLTMLNSAGAHNIFVSNLTNESNLDGRVSVTNCLFREAGRAIAGNIYTSDHTSVYMDAPDSTVSGNYFIMSNLNDSVATAMETHDGNIIISNNTVYGYNKGVNIGAQVQDASGVVIKGNIFNRVMTGVSLWNSGSYVLHHVSIDKNDFRLRENNIVVGIGIEAQPAQMAGIYSGHGLNITGNRFRQLTQTYLDFECMAIYLTKWDKIAISDNEIYDFVGEAIMTEIVPGAKNITSLNISNNLMRGCGISSIPSFKRFVALNAGSVVGVDDINNVLISGNEIAAEAGSGTIAAIGLDFNSGRFPFVNILNNQIVGVSSSPIRKNAIHAADKFYVQGSGAYDPWGNIPASLSSRWLQTTTGKSFTAALAIYDQQTLVWLDELNDLASPPSSRIIPEIAPPIRD